MRSAHTVHETTMKQVTGEDRVPGSQEFLELSQFADRARGACCAERRSGVDVENYVTALISSFAALPGGPVVCGAGGVGGGAGRATQSPNGVLRRTGSAVFPRSGIFAMPPDACARRVVATLPAVELIEVVGRDAYECDQVVVSWLRASSGGVMQLFCAVAAEAERSADRSRLLIRQSQNDAAVSMSG